MRLIDADKLIQDLEGINKVLNGVRLDNIITIIKLAKTIDTASCQGHWKEKDSLPIVVTKTARCSICNFICFSHTYDGQMPNFCPNCGASMKHE